MTHFMKIFLLTLSATFAGFIGVSSAHAQSVMVFSVSNKDVRQIDTELLREVKSRLSRENFMVLEESDIKRIFDEQYIEMDKDNILSRKELITSRYGTPFLIFLNASPPRYDASLAFLSVNAEVFSTASGNYLASWSIPERIVDFEPNCDLSCQNALMLREASYLGVELAEALGSLLTQGSGAIMSTGETIRTIDIEMLDIPEDKRLIILDLMTNEFPGYLKVSNVRSLGPRYKMKYTTTASSIDLNTWLSLALTDIGYNVNEDISLNITDLRIDMRARRIAAPRGRLN
ncbi:hypothetical protein N9M50_02870 [Alphaproteobacteria bacterium]|jgi:hypothetical protein|nr:hypothetical protein [Alphaproteobacteria bacterium]